MSNDFIERFHLAQQLPMEVILRDNALADAELAKECPSVAEFFRLIQESVNEVAHDDAEPISK